MNRLILWGDNLELTECVLDAPAPIGPIATSLHSCDREIEILALGPNRVFEITNARGDGIEAHSPAQIDELDIGSATVGLGLLDSLGFSFRLGLLGEELLSIFAVLLHAGLDEESCVSRSYANSDSPSARDAI